MTPSELLSRAADLIRDTAAAATPGPWRSGEFDRDTGPNVLDAEGRPLFSSACCGGHCYGYVSEQGDAEWIAMLSPADAAPHLEAWLRSTAARLEAWLPTRWPVREDEAAAIRFALSVLGMTVEEAEAHSVE